MSKEVNYDYLDQRIGALFAEKLGAGHELLHDCGLAAMMTSLMIRAARAGGSITDEETHEILVALQEVFDITGAKALELLNTVATELASGNELMPVLAGLQFVLNDEDKETILLLLLRIIAADGKQASAEMAVFSVTVDTLGISAEVVHRVFDRYFEETMILDAE